MSNEYYSNITCNNPDVIDSVAREIFLRYGQLSHLRVSHWDKTEYRVGIDGYSPHKVIAEVSGHFPDDLITCRFSDETTEFSEVHIVEYKGGQENEVGMDINYAYSGIGSLQEHFKLDEDKIVSKVEAFFRRLDTIEKDKDGRLSVDWLDGEVTYKFKQEASDGGKYEIEIRKIGWRVNYKVNEVIEKPCVCSNRPPWEEDEIAVSANAVQ